MDSLKNIGFDRFPFRVIPDEESSKYWAGFPQIKKKLKRFAKKISQNSPSSIQPIWGWYGSGKTHTLLYLKHLLDKCAEDSIYIYTEFSPDISNFLELYKIIMRNIFATNHIFKITDAFREVYSRLNNEQLFIQKICPDFEGFFYGLHHYVFGRTEHKDLIRRWFLGDRIHKNTLKNLSIFNRIEDSQSAVAVLKAIVNLFSNTSRYCNLILLIDEFQRIDTLPSKKKEIFQAYLEFFFNSCPNNLHFVLAYSGRQANKIKELISPAMYSRIGVVPIIKIKILSPDEAIHFIKELIILYKTKDFQANNDISPFNDESIQEIVNFFVKEKWVLKARNIMEVCKTILEEFVYDFEEENTSIITPKYVESLLSDLSKTDEIVTQLKKLD